MKAIRVNKLGDADVLEYEEIDAPEPASGEVRVRVEAAGLNFIDIYQRTGQYNMNLPFTPGQEGAGVVDAMGPGVEEFQPGDRVAWAMQNGSYAEEVCIPAKSLVRVPEGISSQQAAAVMLQGLTAHYLCTSTYAVKQGDKTLVHAAAGGVGHLLVQMIKRQGGWIAATVSTEEKAQLARSAGADETILYTQADFEEEVKRLTGGKGLEVVYDSVGKDTFDKSLNCLKMRGYMVLYGQSSGAVPPVNPQILNQKGSLYLTRPGLNAYIATREEFEARCEEIFAWMEAGDLEVRIDQAFPLADAPDAHRYMEARKTKGKVLLIP
ncbi:MAG: quinone oxidoreductase family protein [Caldilineaceae bacterium]|jgi:NADPH2:quinone reductase